MSRLAEWLRPIEPEPFEPVEYDTLADLLADDS